MTNDLPQIQGPVLLGEGELDVAKVMPALSEQERAQVSSYANQLHLDGQAEVGAYAAAEQGAMQTWLDVAINAVAEQGESHGEQSVNKMLGYLRDFEHLCAARSLLFGRASFSRLRKGYQELEPAVERVADDLLDQSIGLRKVSKVLERMDLENQGHLQRLSTYLLCGQVRLKQLQVANGKDGAAPSTDIGERQEQTSLEKRLHDIAISRLVALQTRAQLKLLQAGNANMIDTMERTLRQTLPLWKSQVLVSLGLSAQLDVQAEVERTRKALQRDMAVRNSWLERLLTMFRGGAQKEERAALKKSNIRLLDAVTDMQKALRAQQAQSELTQDALRGPAAQMRG